MTPKRVVVNPLGLGRKRVLVSCRCSSVGRDYGVETTVTEAVAELLADHRVRSPLCRHPDPPGIGARP